MIFDRNKLDFVAICFWFSCLTAVVTIAQSSALPPMNQNDENGKRTTTADGNGIGNVRDPSVRVLKPRVDYNNEWRPVGRGDPLKNDPTYDYSPPALERVRYWADNSEKDEKNNIKKDIGGLGVKGGGVGVNKNEVLLLGVPIEQRLRGGHIASVKNGKSETPLLQPKYTSIRRSYYGHNHGPELPTRLMPPPMQNILQSLPHSMKSPSVNEYRISKPNYMISSSSISPLTGMSTYSKPYYSTGSTSSWTHSPTTTIVHQNMMPAHMSSIYDAHSQGSVNYFSYARPSSSSSSHMEFHSPNAIRSSHVGLKPSAAISASPRKPWLHELLQKEVVVKPTSSSSTKYTMPVTRPTYDLRTSVGISTTRQPIVYMHTTTTTTPAAPTMLTYPPTPIYITSAAPPTIVTTIFSDTSSSMYPYTALSTKLSAASASVSPKPSPSPSPPPTPSSTRLIIPNTSNLAERPTVAPMELTTDSLFKHYKQPKKPLVGPMYLIIEGHSKVKTYGQNELDPHQPKIVPIIPKREPIVRIGNPNEKRGTIESFQVEHLHAKTTPLMTTTTPMTTMNPIVSTTPSSAPLRPTPPRLSVTTQKTPVETPKKSEKLDALDVNATSEADPHPIGMQSFFSMLDSSLSSFFEKEPIAIDDRIQVNSITTIAPSRGIQFPELDARVSNTGSNITSISQEDDESLSGTTEYVPREVRHANENDPILDTINSFTNDHLRNDSLEDFWFKSTYDETFDDEDDLEGIDNEDNNNEDDDDDDNNKSAENDYEDDGHQLIKRIDKFVNDDDEFKDMDLEENDSFDINNGRSSNVDKNK